LGSVCLDTTAGRNETLCEEAIVAERTLSRARAGHERAFRELSDPVPGKLQLHRYRMLGSVQDAEGLLQEKLLAARLRLERFDGRSSRQVWRYRIATNRCRNAPRDKRRRPRRLEQLAEPPEPTRRREPIWLEPYPDAFLGAAYGFIRHLLGYMAAIREYPRVSALRCREGATEQRCRRPLLTVVRSGLRTRGDVRCGFRICLRSLKIALFRSALSAGLGGRGSPRRGVSLFARRFLCGLRSQGGSDRVEVDQDGGPDGLERRFWGPEVAALAPSVAVDDESEQPLDSGPGALEMVALGGLG
jgi:Sigma-70 region 2